MKRKFSHEELRISQEEKLRARTIPSGKRYRRKPKYPKGDQQ